jgi:hypothetical protein
MFYKIDLTDKPLNFLFVDPNSLPVSLPELPGQYF